MYPVDRAELSQARAQMMARRRRSLTVLVGGTTLFLLLAFVMGGADVGARRSASPPASAATSTSCARRRCTTATGARGRQERAAARHVDGYNVTDDVARFEEFPESVVRIDDDDLQLHNMDTIDLTGLYVADRGHRRRRRAERRASSSGGDAAPVAAQPDRSR